MKKSTLLAVAMLSASVMLGGCQSMDNPQARSEFDCIAGTVGGAVVGGLLGSMVGGGTGKTIATVAGAGAGGYAGNQLGCK
ncbi:glycine zipper 2TM domain-containing protein [Kerstersia sp.]|uniref:glycine zipper 2TM domain-containing protein n=1 Tax=Kerstersia sp. TaxID=1930783 RepID=UPI003F8E5D71